MTTPALASMLSARTIQLLARLTADATRPESVYRHVWKPGDAILWDNRATMHRGRPWPGSEVRSMVRTTISATEADILILEVIGARKTVSEAVVSAAYAHSDHP